MPTAQVTIAPPMEMEGLCVKNSFVMTDDDFLEEENWKDQAVKQSRTVMGISGEFENECHDKREETVLWWLKREEAHEQIKKEYRERSEAKTEVPSEDTSTAASEVDSPTRNNDLVTSDNALMQLDTETMAPPILPDKLLCLHRDPNEMVLNKELADQVKDVLQTMTNEQGAVIAEWMQPALLYLALSANGTEVVQAVLAVTDRETQIKLSHCFYGHVLRLLASHHGNHVLQKCAEVMPPHAVQFLLFELSYHPQGWLGVANHKFGCRILQRLLEHSGNLTMVPFLEEVLTNIKWFSQGEFSNHVVKHILEHVPAYRTKVVRALIQCGLHLLAQHEFARHVVEHALFGLEDPSVSKALIEHILSTPGTIVQMAYKRYATDMVKQLLKTLEGTLRDRALQQLASAIPKLRASKNKAARCIANHVEKALQGKQSPMILMLDDYQLHPQNV